MKQLLDKWYHKKVHINLSGMSIAVVVLDIKERWGKIRYQVSPVAGKGDVWVEAINEIA